MPRYKLTPMQDLPPAFAESHSEVAHDGDEASVSQRLNDLHALTGVPFEANEDTGEDGETKPKRKRQG
ncbi:hypothetical protein [Methylobacterium sp.]|uniref:hypothetical protein n=1 Tax=Methylobacterium sp. TaxID=409 RepID=UPI000C5D97B3|nr:hypothetical protein [Methylobacterium sp.]MBP27861.1 hypothetical protein [Methylobacterium sp.]